MRATFALLAVLAALSATPALALDGPLVGLLSPKPTHTTIFHVFDLTPAHQSASLSHVFAHGTVGFATTRITVVPRTVPVILRVRTTTATPPGQPPDIVLCTPSTFCKRYGAPGAVALHHCRRSGEATICQLTIPSNQQDPIFRSGLFVMSVQEFQKTHVRVSLRMTFIRGQGA